MSSVKMGESKSINKPEVDKNKYPNAEYVGVKVEYKEEIKTSENIYNEIEKKEKVNIKIEDNKTYVNFVFKVKEYTLTLKWQDLNDNDLQDKKEKSCPPGKEIKPDVPTTIEKDGITYKYKERTDGKDQTDKIIVDSKKEVIFKYEPQTVPLTIEYRDEITKEKIPKVEDSEIPANPNEDIAVRDAVEKAESEMGKGYKFTSRSDGKGHWDNADGISEPKTIVFYYIDLEPSDKKGLPVVSYPEIPNGNEVALGEEIKVKVPNIGDHQQMIELGYDQPTGGWNSKYAQVKYLICGCDVYYGKTLYTANTPIQIATREGDTISEYVTLVIPEWVKEDTTYTIEAIVSSKTGDISSFKIGEKYNWIYDETAARGKCTIEVKGKVYDFRITNLIEDKYWPSSLFKDNSTGYAASTLPIGQGDKKPAKYNYGISLGSTFFFNVNTIGQNNKKISIEPQFKYVRKNGEIEEADIYVKNNGKYEKLEETTLELQTTLNNEYKKVRTDLEAELKKGLEMKEYNLSPNTKSSIGKYSGLSLDSTQKVPYVKYFEEEEITRYDENKKEQVLEAVSHWYGEYRLPSSTKVMEKGNTPGNGTEYKDGFIIVMFKITTQDSSNNEYLVYDDQTVGNQWVNEGGTAEGAEMTIQLPKVSGQTKDKATIKVENGYYPVAIYQVGISTNGSYEVAGTH